MRIKCKPAPGPALLIGFVAMFSPMSKGQAEITSSTKSSVANQNSRSASITNCGIATVELVLRRFGVDAPDKKVLDEWSAKESLSVAEVRTNLEHAGLSVDVFATSKHPSDALRQHIERLGSDSSIAIALLPNVQQSGVGHYIMVDHYRDAKLTGIDPQNGMPFQLDWDGISNDENSVVLAFVSLESKMWLLRSMNENESIAYGVMTIIFVGYTTWYIISTPARNNVDPRLRNHKRISKCVDS